jgi:hypothetical protein
VARIVVAGYAVRFPLGGNLWAHLQYVLGLRRLGHEVTFVEDAGWADSCYDPATDLMSSDPSPGLGIVGALMQELGLGDAWAFRDLHGRWHGIDRLDLDELLAEADLFLDVGGASHFPEMRRARRTAHVDMDPVFTQLGAFGADRRLDEYDALFTYGARIGRDGCAIPTGGYEWHPLRPPVVLDLWERRGSDAASGAAASRWTTITQWFSYGPLEHGGVVYGQKDVEFLRFLDLPRQTSCAIEIAVGREAPLDELRARDWHVADPVPISSDPWRYRAYIQGSRGEFSVAKNAYVKTRSGWFSDRTATYLAAGRPAVVQDTGLDGDLRTGEGLLVFGTIEEAVAALDRVEAAYDAHSETARELAETALASDKVLTYLFDRAGV